MGAPKQKWTSEEEAALKAGVARYGVGKWSTILKDPEFRTILHSRSNVDLKDKWRNLHVMANGLGSRRARPGQKSTPPIPRHDDNTLALKTLVEKDSENLDIQPLALDEIPSNVGAKKPIPRLDDLVLEAITKLKEPRGSNRNAIALYIEEHYSTPPTFERLLATSLKMLTENGRLIRVKHQYRIAPKAISFNARAGSLVSVLDGKQKDSSKVEKDGTRTLTKAQIDAELDQMRSMTAQEAAAAAAKAVAEAEAAIAEAEKAAKEAEEAEAEAEAAQCFAEAAMKALTCRTIHA